MIVPSHLNQWADAMKTSPETSQILQNLQDEACIDPATEEEFWRRVESAGTPTDSSAAWKAARNSIWQSPSLNRKRNLVAAGHFDRLVRFTLPTKLPDMFPALDLASTGLTRAALDSATSTQIQELLDEAATSASVDFQLLVWVTEQSPALDAVRATASDLMDRLGLKAHYAQITGGGCCVEIQYDRSSLPSTVSLHVPSALDGIDNDQFRPRNPCSVAFGATEPLTSGSGPGFPEAVHESCSVMNFDVKLLSP
ncbi:hypothetical protein [Prosthecobacter fluviatilis]|uniref:Uncharacterized protein n=1 Tax=Prosthecobacter fluviatilis TaxID=445931 RepID=A0ABW0KUR9_9BACT